MTMLAYRNKIAGKRAVATDDEYMLGRWSPDDLWTMGFLSCRSRESDYYCALGFIVGSRSLLRFSMTEQPFQRPTIPRLLQPAGGGSPSQAFVRC